MKKILLGIMFLATVVAMSCEPVKAEGEPCYSDFTCTGFQEFCWKGKYQVQGVCVPK